MPDFQALINDPDYQSLPPDRQTAIRQDFFTAHVAKDPDFQSLTPEKQAQMQQEIVGGSAGSTVPRGTPPESATFQKLAEPPKTVGEAVIQGAKNIPSAVIGGLKQLGKAAITQPEGGFLNIHSPQETARRLMDLAQGAASGASLGIYEPPAPTTEAEAARRTGGAVAGVALPFSIATKGVQALGAGQRLAQIAAGGLTGAVEPLTRGDVLGAVEGATTGAGSIIPAQVAAAIPGRIARTAGKIAQNVSNRSQAKALGGATGILEKATQDLSGGTNLEAAGQALQTGAKEAATAARAAASEKYAALDKIPATAKITNSASDAIRDLLPESGSLSTAAENKLNKLATDLEGKSGGVNIDRISGSSPEFRQQLLSALGISNRPTMQEVQGYLRRLAEEKPTTTGAGREQPQPISEATGREPTSPPQPTGREPAAPEPTVRLYRGAGTEQIALPEWAKLNAGEWFTSDKAKAQHYAGMREGGQVNFIDVPESIYRQYQARPGLADDEFLVPKVVQKNLGVQTEPPALETGRGREQLQPLPPATGREQPPPPRQKIVMGESGVRGMEQPTLRELSDQLTNEFARTPLDYDKIKILRGQIADLEQAKKKVQPLEPPAVGSSQQEQAALDYLKTLRAASEPTGATTGPAPTKAQFRNQDYKAQAAQALKESAIPTTGMTEQSPGLTIHELESRSQSLGRLGRAVTNDADRRLYGLAQKAVDADIQRFGIEHPEYADALKSYAEGRQQYKETVVPYHVPGAPLRDLVDKTNPSKTIENLGKMDIEDIRSSRKGILQGPRGKQALAEIQNGVKEHLLENSTQNDTFNPKKFVDQFSNRDDVRKLRTLLGDDEYQKVARFKDVLRTAGADEWGQKVQQGGRIGKIYGMLHILRGIPEIITAPGFALYHGYEAGMMFLGPTLFRRLAETNRGAKLLAAGAMAPAGSLEANHIAAALTGVARGLGGQPMSQAAIAAALNQSIQQNEPQQGQTAAGTTATGEAAVVPPKKKVLINGIPVWGHPIRGHPATQAGSSR